MEEIKSNTNDGHYSVNSGYEVCADNEDVFSIIVYKTSVMASSATEYKAYTVDKKNNSVVTLESLFKDKSYINIISENIKEQMKEQMKADENKIYFIYDETAWNEMLLGMIRAALWNMSMIRILKLFFRGVRVVYIAATDGRYGGAMAVGDGIDGIHAKSLYLDIKTPLDKWIRQIKEFQPNVIIGYPSAIKILGELVEKRSIQFDIFRVISCGEPLGASLRHYLENVFQAEVINFYGASESLALGVEMDTAEGMILFDDMNVIEVQNGNMYLTSLYNFAQPLIRYRLSDSLTLRKPDENSRYPFTRAVGLLGREEDILWFEDRNGHREFLHPLAIEGFCLEGLKDYQFRQTCKDTFEMLAEISDSASENRIRREILLQMKGILRGKGLDYVQFFVKFVDEILPDLRTSKKRLIIKEIQKMEA